MSEYETSLVDALKSVVLDSTWQRIGAEADLRHKKCRKLYAEDGEHLVLIYVEEKDEFYAMEAVCAHEGGPLEMGDIEDLGEDKWVIVCPWHHFEFDVVTGENSFGLSQKTFELKRIDGEVFVNSPEMLSLSPDAFLPASDDSKKENDLDAPAKARLLIDKMRKSNGILLDDVQNTGEDVTDNLATDQLENEDKHSKISSEEPRSLEEYAVVILKTADPDEKVRLTYRASKLWLDGYLELYEGGSVSAPLTPPDTPWRQEDLNFIKPEKIKRGKGGTLASRIALIHSLANIEQWAIDLSWDVIARFTSFSSTTVPRLPCAFYGDFVKVAVDEAKHFKLLQNRLKELGSHFGALPVHNALWQSASDTKDSLLARLAIVHMVHEARGLDVHPKTRQRFAAQKDDDSVAMLEVIFRDEITHVEAGLKWFSYVCATNQPNLDPVLTFHKMVRQYFQGYLKPPFNTEARETAGMTEEWYLPLVKRTDEIKDEVKV